MDFMSLNAIRLFDNKNVFTYFIQNVSIYPTTIQTVFTYLTKFRIYLQAIDFFDEKFNYSLSLDKLISVNLNILIEVLSYIFYLILIFYINT